MINSIYLAPLHGITDCIFRNVFESHFGNFEKIIAPFITSVKGNKIRKSHFSDLDPRSNDIKRLVPQILGNDPEQFIVLANTLSSMGYRSVNWNLGCPFPMVIGKKRGAGLLPFPDRIDSFLERITQKTTCSLSVKIRLGLKSPHDLEKLVPIFNRYPIEEIIIHPRTADQMYEGSADADAFGHIYHQLKMPAVYNGDIFTTEEFEKLTGRFPDVNRWMIGRGALRNPFLVPSIHAGKPVFDLETLRRYHDELYIRYNASLPTSSHLLGRMKGLWQYLSEMFSGRNKEIKAVMKAGDKNAYEKAVDVLLTV
jgi:tRNA-dihydrouridine synthase B